MSRAAVALGLLFVVAVVGCGSPAPSAACEPPGNTPLVDAARGFSICLPGPWRDLRPGDAGWAVIYDEANSQPEQDVASGALPHFAVPLEPRDLDTTVNLAIYVQPNEGAESTKEVGDRYAQVVGDRGDTVIAVSMVMLPVGEVAELIATVANERSDVSLLVSLDAFVVVTPETRYYLLFRCSIESRAAYEGQFESIASTFTLLP